MKHIYQSEIKGQKNSYLTSDINYQILDKRFMGDGESNKCNFKNSTLNDDLYFFSFCASLIGNLKNLNNMTFLMLFDNSRCVYLDLWIYDRLNNGDIKYSKDSPEYQLIKEKVQELIKHYSTIKTCEFNFDTMNNIQFQKTKMLCDYPLIHNQIQFYLKKHIEKYTPEDDKYIKDILQLYNEVKAECETRDQKYCNMLNNIEKKYSFDLLKQLEEIKLDNPKTHSNLEGRELRPQAMPGEDKSMGDAATTDTIQGPRVWKAMLTVYVFVGISMIFFLIYKFSPYIPWLRDSPLIIKFIRIIKNKARKLKLMKEEHKTENTRFLMHEYLIGYDSM
ncbi:variable surface protein [Plasmodium gonderi]|uniref:Variable surface protein n=1 Tax=Plasmodium gonderi TaxID=77519 RepID=A0A1Y1JHN7_PLAGO|nr:variable surface protein [Plasmodium gonderi]GAW82036.1 variable surface protein [Plasmodium gonderi]